MVIFINRTTMNLERIVKLTKEELKAFQPYFGSKVAVFHDEFMYLINRFKFNANLTLEERPDSSIQSLSRASY